MSSGRDRLAEAFERLTAAPKGGRGAVMDEICRGDDGLRAELESLLAAHDRAGGFLVRPAFEAIGRGDAPPLAPDTRIAGYRVVRALASGGSGAVYEAEQASPHRRVALKVMRAGVGDESASRRFRDEAEILARVEHPAIAHVYEAGIHESDGRAFPWIAMEFVAGAATLVEYALSHGLPTRRRLELFETAALAVHHGHQKGIVHRDLKPANVLVDEAGRVKVIDFGIARAEGMDGAPRLAGTPPYMAPEQCAAGGGDADVRSDVHALGVLLFELLTGRVPYEIDGLPLAEALRVVRETPPLSASALDPTLAGDVDAVLAKALAKDPARRYASAAAFADDVRRHLQDEPVLAVPPTLRYQLGKFARRRRVVFASAVAVALVCVAATAVSAWFAVRADHARTAAERNACVANLAAASAGLRADDVAEAAQRLERVPPALRGWEWRQLEGRIDRSERVVLRLDKPIVWGAASACGRAVAASYPNEREPTLVLFDLAGDAPVRRVALGRDDGRPNALAESPDGALVAVGFDSGFVELRDGADGRLLRRFRAHDDRVVTAVFDRAGRRVATSSRDLSVKVWDAADGRPIHAFPALPDRAIGLAFSPDGARLAAGLRDGAVRVWDAALGTQVAAFAPHAASVEAVSWSPDGSRLATASRDLSVRISDAATGALLATGRGHTRNVRDVAFSPDGLRLATCGYDRTVRVWDAADLRVLAALHGHRMSLFSVAFVDAARFVTFSMDGTARLWSADADEGVAAIPCAAGDAPSFAVSPDGSLAVTADTDGRLRVWDARRRVRVAEHALASRMAATAVAFLPDGRGLVTAERDGRVATWSLPDCAPLETLRQPGVSAAAASDGVRVLLGREDGVVESIDAATGRELASWRGGSGVALLALAPDGAVSASKDGTLAVWADGATAPAATSRPRPVAPLALAADGRRVAASWQDGTTLLLDRRTLAVVARLEGHVGWAPGIAFSPDGSRVATCGHDETVRLWDAAEGTQMLVLDGPMQTVWRIAWSADGRSLAAVEGQAEIGGTIRLWRASSAR